MTTRYFIISVLTTCLGVGLSTISVAGNSLFGELNALVNKVSKTSHKTSNKDSCESTPSKISEARFGMIDSTPRSCSDNKSSEIAKASAKKRTQEKETIPANHARSDQKEEGNGASKKKITKNILAFKGLSIGSDLTLLVKQGFLKCKFIGHAARANYCLINSKQIRKSKYKTLAGRSVKYVAIKSLDNKVVRMYIALRYVRRTDGSDAPNIILEALTKKYGEPNDWRDLGDENRRTARVSGFETRTVTSRYSTSFSPKYWEGVEGDRVIFGEICTPSTYERRPSDHERVYGISCAKGIGVMFDSKDFSIASGIWSEEEFNRRQVAARKEAATNQKRRAADL